MVVIVLGRELEAEVAGHFALCLYPLLDVFYDFIV